MQLSSLNHLENKAQNSLEDVEMSLLFEIPFLIFTKVRENFIWTQRAFLTTRLHTGKWEVIH